MLADREVDEVDQETSGDTDECARLDTGAEVEGVI